MFTGATDKNTFINILLIRVFWLIYKILLYIIDSRFSSFSTGERKMEKLIRDIDDYSYFAQGNNAGQGRPNGYNGGPNPNGYNGGPNGYSGGPNGYNGGPNGYNGGPNGYNNRNGQNNNNNNNNNKKPKNFSAIIFLIIAGVVTFLAITGSVTVC